MKISYIIPYYNSSRRINRAVQSIKSQKTYLDYQVIIVNDFSNEVETEYLNIYKDDKNIEVLNMEKNGGPGLARNKGLQSAVGEYVVFVDSDDYLSDNFHCFLINKLLEVEFDILTFNYNLVFSNVEVVEKKFNHYFISMAEGKVDDLASSFIFSKGAPWGKVIKRSLIESFNIRFSALRTGEDYPFTKSIFATAQLVYHSNSSFYNYVMHEGSIMHSDVINSEEEVLSSIDYISNNLSLSKNSESKGFENAIEALFIKEIIYAMSLVYLNEVNGKSSLKAQQKCWELRYPNWAKNEFIRRYPAHIRLVLFLVKYKMYSILKGVTFLKLKIQRLAGTR